MKENDSGCAKTHYGISLAPKLLVKWSADMADKIKTKLVDEKQLHPVLYFRGFSGAAMATALSLELYARCVEHSSIYVRKDNEESHGSQIEMSTPCELIKNKQCLVFVDDFISSGTTFRETTNKLIRVLLKHTPYGDPNYRRLSNNIEEKNISNHIYLAMQYTQKNSIQITTTVDLYGGTWKNCFKTSRAFLS